MRDPRTMREIGRFGYKDTCQDAIATATVYLNYADKPHYDLKYNTIAGNMIEVIIICEMVDGTTRDFDVTYCHLPVWVHNRHAVLNDVNTTICMMISGYEGEPVNFYGGQGHSFNSSYDPDAAEYQISKARILSN